MSQNYNVFPIPLSDAGTHTLKMFSGVLRLIRAIDASDAINLGVLVEVRLGDDEGDWIPLSFGNAVFGSGTKELTIRWEAQPGVIASFFRSADARVADVDADPPAQLVVGSLASSAAASDEEVGVAAAELVAANSSRKMLTIQNLGADIFIGTDNTVTVANGLKIPTDGSYNTEQYSGAIWAISGSAGVDVRLFEEG